MVNTLNVNALPEYINEHKDELLVKSIAGGKTIDEIALMAGVKHKEALHFLDSEVTLAAATCGWNPDGADTFTDKYVEVKPVSVQKEFCWLDMKEKFMNYQLLFEAGRETLPFEQKIAESNMNAIKDAVEDLVWNGNEEVGIDGLVKQIKDSDATIAAEVAEGASISEAVDAVVAAVPMEALKKGVKVFMSYTDFRKYVTEANSNCCANRPVIDAASEHISYVGDSRITIVPVLGLEGAGVIVAAPASELIYATDLEGSEGVYRMFYDEKERTFNLDVLFNAGTAIRRDDLIVYAEV